MALMNTYGTRALTLTKGEGCHVWDNEGNRYLDLLSGIAVCGLGHCHPNVTQAITEQAGSLLHVSNLYNIEPQVQAATRLKALSKMDNVFFSNSGAEANEAAIKIARKYGNTRNIDTPTIITMTNSFHGRTMATLSATGNPKVKTGFYPLLEGFINVPFNDTEAVAALSSNDQIVAVMVEPVQGEGGIRIPAPDYLDKLRAICDQNEWLLICDEIQSGNARTGQYFAYQHSNSLPDVVTTAKGLGNGMPIGACLARGIASTVLQPGNHGSTYGGNPVACAAALAVMDTIVKDDLCTRVSQAGEYFYKALDSVLGRHSNVLDIRHSGLMIGISLRTVPDNLLDKACKKGILINLTAGNVIRLLPPFIISHRQIDSAVEILLSLINE